MGSMLVKLIHRYWPITKFLRNK